MIFIYWLVVKSQFAMCIQCANIFQQLGFKVPRFDSLPGMSLHVGWLTSWLLAKLLSGMVPKMLKSHVPRDWVWDYVAWTIKWLQIATDQLVGDGCAVPRLPCVGRASGTAGSRSVFGAYEALAALGGWSNLGRTWGAIWLVPTSTFKQGSNGANTRLVDTLVFLCIFHCFVAGWGNNVHLTLAICTCCYVTHAWVGLGNTISVHVTFIRTIFQFEGSKLCIMYMRCLITGICTWLR